MSTAGEPATANLGVPQRNALIVGGVLLILGTLYGVFRPEPFFRAYLVAFEFCLGISLGCMARDDDPPPDRRRVGPLPAADPRSGGRPHAAVAGCSSCRC